ncbi:MAG TPA: DUF177 domain-containing protein [Clostridiales bacterium]|nr:DUF177 domain-containing protein [Clostridiales bacterium]
MEVSISEILVNEGIKKEFYFFEDIDNNIIEFFGEKISIKKPIKVEGYAVNYEGKIRLYINIQTELARSCSRCLGLYNEMIDIDAEYVFVTSPDKQSNDEILIDGETIILDEYVLDEITSQMTMKPLCKPDCKGLCFKCGKNKNYEECDCTFDEIDPRLQELSRFLRKE